MRQQQEISGTSTRKCNVKRNRGDGNSKYTFLQRRAQLEAGAAETLDQYCTGKTQNMVDGSSTTRWHSHL